MAAFRWIYHLEDYLTETHFRRMGYLLLALALIYGYFTFAEYLTPAYKMAAAERGYLAAILGGPYARIFWFTQIGGVLLPILLLTVPRISWVPHLSRTRFFRPAPALAVAATAAVAIFLLPAPLARMAALEGVEVTRQLPLAIALALGVWLFLSLLPVLRRRPVPAVVVASLLVSVGAWLKRFIIIVPTLANPFLPIQRAPEGWAVYRPTWVEWSITAGAVAGFILLYLLFSKLFPIVSLWETREEQAGHEAARTPALDRIGIAHAPAP